MMNEIRQFKRLPPLRVALVTETYPPEINGVAMTLGRIVGGLAARGHRVQLVRPRQQAGDQPIHAGGLEEVLVRGFPIPRYAELHFGLPDPGQLKRLWQKQCPDIVHVATQGPLGWAAVSAARALKLPVSSSFHTNFDAYSRHYGIGLLKPLIGRYLRHFHNRTNATLVPTRALAEQLGDEGYRNTLVVSRGVDTRLFNPQRRSQSLRRLWGASPETLVVSYVGRLAAEKNLDLVFASFEEIRRHRPDSRLVLVGDGPLRASRARRYPDHVFAGMRRGEDLATHYASSDLFLFPSLTETFGNVTSEALASGLALVAFNCAAAAELVEDGHNGFLAPPGDNDAFIQSALNLATHRGMISRVRLRSAASVAHLDWDNVHDKFAGTLTAVVALHRRRQRAQDALVMAPD
jgi:glycosyltransferase involved in cell wall biosynthesis